MLREKAEARDRKEKSEACLFEVAMDVSNRSVSRTSNSKCSPVYFGEGGLLIFGKIIILLRTAF